MRDRALVVRINENHVLVLPLLTDTCINCNEAACAKKGTPFPVVNSKKLPIVVGSVVKVTASVKKQAFQAVIALFLPILAAVGGYFMPLLFFTNLTESVRALFVLLAFFFVSTIVFFTRRRIGESSAEITEIEYTELVKNSNPLLKN